MNKLLAALIASLFAVGAFAADAPMAAPMAASGAGMMATKTPAKKAKAKKAKAAKAEMPAASK